jgi:hypothetical protein
MRVALVLIACVLLSTGCGGDNPASKAFGGLTDADMQAIQEVSRSLQSAGTDFTTMNARLEAENVAGARPSLDSAAPKLDQAEDDTLDIDNADLRRTMQDYVGVTRTVLAAFDRWIAYFEDDTMARDEALEHEMLSDIEAATTAARKADQDFLNRILDKATPKQRDEIRARYRQAIDAQSEN